MPKNAATGCDSFVEKGVRVTQGRGRACQLSPSPRNKGQEGSSGSRDLGLLILDPLRMAKIETLQRFQK